MSAAEFLTEVKRAVEAATPGPWTMDNSGWSRPYHIPDRIVGGVSDEDWTNVIMPQDEQGGASWAHDEDAAFIARARTDVPRLVAALEAVLALHGREVIAVHEGYGEEAWCPLCQQHWPCDTTMAIEAALAAEEEGDGS